MFKRLIGCLSVLCILPVWLLGADFSFPYDAEITNTNKADIGKSFKDNALGTDSTSEELQRTYNVAWDSEWDQRATDYIRIIINWFLAIIGLVALIVIIIWFYKMLVSWDSEAAWWEARKLVMNAAIALTVIGIAWFVVSWFFDIFFIVSSEI
jgi:hypothetical protein